MKLSSCEPQSPLGFRLTLVGFSPSPVGGLATIRVAVQPREEMGEIEISGRLERGMTFSDGSTEKAWWLSVVPGNTGEFTEEIQIPENGLFFVVLNAEAALTSGRPVHRSGGLKIWAGTAPPQPRRRGRALEYPGVRPGEPLP